MQKVSDDYNLKLLRDVVCARAGGHCEWPGCACVDCDPHHVFGRANKATRYLPDNCVFLCSVHHREAEASPRDFHAIMIAMRGNSWWSTLVTAKNQVVKFNDAFRKEWKERLQNELRRLAA